jgi:hypothetical protein
MSFSIAALDAVRPIAAVASALLMSACASPNSNDTAASQAEPRAERELPTTDFRFADPACSQDNLLLNVPGVFRWDGRTASG